jgi:hypothetical protein
MNKSGTFRNVSCDALHVGGNSIVAPIEYSGKIVIDTSATVAVVMTATTHANCIYIFAKTPSGARAITLPALTDMEIGDKIHFVVAEQSGTGSNIVTISEKAASDTNKIIGCVTLVTGADAATGTNVTNRIATSGDAIGVTSVALSADTSGNDAGSEGTELTFTCTGSDATLGQYWLISGIALSLDPNGTGAALFGA